MITEDKNLHLHLKLKKRKNKCIYYLKIHLNLYLHILTQYKEFTLKDLNFGDIILNYGFRRKRKNKYIEI